MQQTRLFKYKYNVDDTANAVFSPYSQNLISRQATLSEIRRNAFHKYRDTLNI